MAYKTSYQEDSDADDEYERSVVSPALPPDFESSPTDSDAPSTEHTPTTFTHSAGDSHASPTGRMNEWTSEQCADWVSSLGLPQYGDTFLDEGISGDALIALHHAELKEMGMSSVGHRLTILKSVYDVKVKQNIHIEPDHYVPLSAEAGPQETPPTQDDFARIIRIIKDRDERIHTAEAELRILKDDLQRIMDENRRLREEFLPVVRLVKDRSQPLPTPDGQDGHMNSPAGQERTGSSLSRKFSTKKLFLGNAPKNPSPTIYEGRPLTDASHLEQSAAALAASNNLTASLGAGHATSPHSIAHPSPTSPAYSQHTVANSIRTVPRTESRTHTNDDNYSSYNDRDTTRGTTPNPLNARPLRSNVSVSTPDAIDPPLSGGTITSSGASIAPTPTTSGSSNPQVEIFKSFRVSIDDPCHKVLPVALKKYNITADWRQYALYIVHGDQERCLGLNERPLILFKQLDKEGRKPMFMLRKHAAPEQGHVSTVSGGPPQSVGQGSFDNSQSRWTGGSVQLPGGVL
ncbi:RA-domain-containing protein [Pseudovirgaria hyperparasitica]|uniref:RA-domain-containing protein n=1 Tax=Pseudovirgaria hyperparasitica TaxID=470096 RepID=A0A6A6WJT9_9PEZI|nr:RA-domain-containing protein [Pseudovirgaria hyperparasitica]KAF2762550.1 RA-domain-containing protein [Pseudovirgaria hyperparasitica]